MIKAVFFDLDGTLLPMELDIFMKAYLGSLAKALAPIGYDPDRLVKSILSGSYAMVKNDGSMSNEDVFWNCFNTTYGIDGRKDEKYFYDFYVNEFDKIHKVCGYNPQALQVVKSIKNMGIRMILATNPLFPSIATEKRVSWAGLDKGDFELITTYENSRFCKPNINYYKDILSSVGLRADEVLMVGNDVDEDMVASSLGMKVFLVTDQLINKSEKDVSMYPNGNLLDMLEYLKSQI